MTTKPVTKQCDRRYPILHGQAAVAHHQCSHSAGHEGPCKCWCGMVFTPHMIEELSKQAVPTSERR
jgi:hypothetical protein